MTAGWKRGYRKEPQLRCVRCGLEKPLDAFRLLAHGSRGSWCKPCVAASTREWRARNREAVNARTRERYAANREAERARSNARYAARRAAGHVSTE